MKILRQGVPVFVLALVVVASSVSAAPWMDSLLGKDLDSLVGKQLGLTGDQSKGGIGAILGLAKEKLNAVDFDKIAAVVPGADKYVSKAKKMGLLDKPIGNKAGLTSAFQKIGLSEEQGKQLLSTVTDMIGKAGGESVQKLMSSFLG